MSVKPGGHVVLFVALCLDCKAHVCEVFTLQELSERVAAGCAKNSTAYSQKAFTEVGAWSVPATIPVMEW